MIPYHGTPLGGKNCEKPAFLRGRHALVSFAHPQDLEVVAECCQSFVFDNGAFSAWRSGNPVKDWKPYYEWCKQWMRHPGFDWCIIPDVIDGGEARYYVYATMYAIIGRDMKVKWFQCKEDGDYATSSPSNPK